MKRIHAALIALLPVAPAFGQEQQPPAAQPEPSPWYQVPADAVYTTGDTWQSGGVTYRLYGVQSCLRGTFFTNGQGARLDCGEANLAMTVSLIRDLRPWCYTAAQQPSTKTNFVVCVATMTAGSGKGSRLDLGTALISTGFGFAALQPTGLPVHEPYLVAQALAQKQKRGLWQFADVPDPNAAILNALRAGSNQTPPSPPQ